MTRDHPLILVALIGLAAWCFWYWLRDLRAPPADGRRFPGATQANAKVLLAAVLGSLYFLAVDLVGRHQLDLLDEAPPITALMAVFMLAWAFLEELALRGYLVIESRGPLVLLLCILGYSLATTLLVQDSLFGKGVAFMTAMWYFALRFCRWNSARSLLPCIVAHLTTNLGLILVRVFQKKISGLW
jgi:uncharacterized membrane protein (UPF0136 family)